MTSASDSLTARLEKLLPASQVSADPQVCADASAGELFPSIVATPASAEEAAEVVRFAAGEHLSVVPIGARTKLRAGPPPTRYDLALDMTLINRIAHYDASDLTLSVDAGISLRSLSSALAASNQFLPLSVPFSDRATVGGTVASGVDSLLRPLYGTARDFLIGAEFIDGTGSLCRSGGRVVKNVTGYDLHKLLIGSLGSLAVITRLNFRTFPLPREFRVFAAAFSSPDYALDFHRRVSASPLTPSLVEILDPGMVGILAPSVPESARLDSSQWHVFVGFEGVPEVCSRYARTLSLLAELAHPTDAFALEPAESAALHENLRELLPGGVYRAFPAAAIFRVPCLPSQLEPLLTQLRSAAARSSVPCASLIRNGTTICLAVSLESSASEALFPSFAAICRGLAPCSVLWGPAWLRKSSAPAADSADMLQRVKSAFDPASIFSPGR